MCYNNTSKPCYDNISTTRSNTSTSYNVPKSLEPYLTISSDSLYTPTNAVVFNGNDLVVKNYKTEYYSWSIPIFDRYKIRKVVYNGPATVVFFKDGSKSAVKIASNSEVNIYDDRESAVMYAVLKQIFGTRWRKELKRYHYALECCLPMQVIEEYYCDLDNAYLRTMIERFDREHGTCLTDQIRGLEFVRWLKWGEFEHTGKLVIFDSDCEKCGIKNRRNDNGSR